MRTALAVAMVLVATVSMAGTYDPPGPGNQNLNYNYNINQPVQTTNQSQNQTQSVNNQVSATASTSAQGTGGSVRIDNNSPGTMFYPWPWTTQTPSMNAPATPKAWQMSLSLWDDSIFPYANILATIPFTVEMHGRLISKSRGTGTSVRIYKGKDRPKSFYRVGSYVVVAKTQTIDATVLEDAALTQAKKDGASGIVERERGFYTQNNIKGSAGGLGMALSILGSIGGNATGFGPTGGFQSSSYMSNQDVYSWIAFDTLEVLP